MKKERLISGIAVLLVLFTIALAQRAWTTRITVPEVAPQTAQSSSAMKAVYTLPNLLPVIQMVAR